MLTELGRETVSVWRGEGGREGGEGRDGGREGKREEREGKSQPSFKSSISFPLTSPLTSKRRQGAAGVDTSPCGVRFVGLGAEQVHVGCGLTLITGDIAKGRDGSLGVSADLGVEMVLQGVEHHDENMDVIDTDAHLWVWHGQRVGVA